MAWPTTNHCCEKVCWPGALVRPLTKIFNVSITTGTFPSSLKKGAVQPTLKPTLDLEQYSSYRPIANIAFLSKTIERLAATQACNYLTDNDLLPKFQSAYRMFHNTETALVRVCNDILMAIDQHCEVVLVLLDLSSAFDSSDHDALLERFHKRYGLSGTVLCRFKSYLSGRTQSVIIKDTESSEVPVTHVVPQGSVLRPILFAHFFAPLEDIIAAHGLTDAWCTLMTHNCTTPLILVAGIVNFLNFNFARTMLWLGVLEMASCSILARPETFISRLGTAITS